MGSLRRMSREACRVVPAMFQPVWRSVAEEDAVEHIVLVRGGVRSWEGYDGEIQLCTTHVVTTWSKACTHKGERKEMARVYFSCRAGYVKQL